MNKFTEYRHPTNEIMEKITKIISKPKIIEQHCEKRNEFK